MSDKEPINKDIVDANNVYVSIKEETYYYIPLNHPR